MFVVATACAEGCRWFRRKIRCRRRSNRTETTQGWCRPFLQHCLEPGRRVRRGWHLVCKLGGCSKNRPGTDCVSCFWDSARRAWYHFRSTLYLGGIRHSGGIRKLEHAVLQPNPRPLKATPPSRAPQAKKYNINNTSYF